MNIRGQVTIFILVALIVVAFVGFFVVVSNFKGVEKKPQYSFADPVGEFAEDCLRESAKESVYAVGQGGGYFSLPLDFFEEGVTYHFFNGKSYVPTKSHVENELSDAFKEFLPFCIDNFSAFPEVNVSEGELVPRATVESEQVVFVVNYPLLVKKGKESVRITDFGEISVPVKLGLIRGFSQSLVDSQMAGEGICLTCISNFASENNLTVDVISLDNNSLKLVFKDEGTNFGERGPFEFVFAIKYGEG